ncbi:MAG: PASTA domain-containing protein [Brevinematia bacterium]
MSLFQKIKFWIIKFENKARNYFSTEGADIYTRLVRRIFFVFVLAGVIACFAILLVLLIARISYPLTKVPDVSEKDIITAIVEIQKKGLSVVVEPVFNTNYAKYTVIKQFPSKGLTVRKGRSVTIVVSLGKDVYTVPDVVGKSKEEAEDLLVKSNISFTTTIIRDQSYPLGVVISQEPSPGIEVERGVKMKLLVNSDVEAGKFRVEDYKNQSVENVVRMMIQNSITPLIEKQIATSVDDDGKVLDQSISAGSVVPLNSEIKLFVGVYGDSEEEIKLANYHYFYYNFTSMGGELKGGSLYNVKVIISDELSSSKEIYTRNMTEPSPILTVFKSYGKTHLVLIVNNSMVKEVYYE